MLLPFVCEAAVSDKCPAHRQGINVLTHFIFRRHVGNLERPERVTCRHISMPSLSDYQAERNALIEADRALRVDHVRPSTSLERQADQIVRRIRAGDAESVWSVQQDEVPHPFPGMEFLTGWYIVDTGQFMLITC